MEDRDFQEINDYTGSVKTLVWGVAIFFGSIVGTLALIGVMRGLS